MHIHILGICGTFMAGIAILAKQQGHHVTGSDTNVYPPMSTQLLGQGISVFEGYDPVQLQPTPDIIIVGNAMKRGNPMVEHLLNANLPYTSGPQWLAENILKNRWVLAVAGTHGKTTTTSLLSWILHFAGLDPGYLIGGIPKNFNTSATLGGESFFVIEADEYDTAFFDKRSKFIHYHPHTAILNNLEFDHADIFPDLNAIKTQFHHLVRTIPGNGLIIYPHADNNIQDVLAQGCWTPTQTIDYDWQVKDHSPDYSQFTVYLQNTSQGTVNWKLLGQHNMHNALAAIAAARHVGIKPEIAIAALAEFEGIKRRLEIRDQINDITIYDDFAHHPTAIATTLNGLRHRIGNKRILAVIELGSYTMRTGVHKAALVPALQEANQVFIARPKVDWGVDEVANKLAMPACVYETVEAIIVALIQQAQPHDHIIIMSNTGFAGIHEKLITELKQHHSQ